MQPSCLDLFKRKQGLNDRDASVLNCSLKEVEIAHDSDGSNKLQLREVRVEY